MAERPGHRLVFHFTPKHGLWLNQAEPFFSVLARQVLRRGDFASAAAFTERLTNYTAHRPRPACPVLVS